MSCADEQYRELLKICYFVLVRGKNKMPMLPDVDIVFNYEASYLQNGMIAL